MDNKTTIGIGVVLLAGVGYYLYTKNKKNQTPLVNMTKASTFDRDKASREWSELAFKREAELRAKNNGMVKQGVSLVTDAKTGKITEVPVMNEIKSELSIYYNMLKLLNSITDDSDAEFIFNRYKTMLQSKDDPNYKLDLGTQIKMDSIYRKYPKVHFDI
jgi:hypothetical protein